VTSVFHLQLAISRVWLLLYLSSSTYDFVKLLGKVMPRLKIPSFKRIVALPVP